MRYKFYSTITQHVCDSKVPKTLYGQTVPPLHDLLLAQRTRLENH